VARPFCSFARAFELPDQNIVELLVLPDCDRVDLRQPDCVDTADPEVETRSASSTRPDTAPYGIPSDAKSLRAADCAASASSVRPRANKHRFAPSNACARSNGSP